jgi:hypothetical protein
LKNLKDVSILTFNEQRAPPRRKESRRTVDHGVSQGDLAQLITLLKNSASPERTKASKNVGADVAEIVEETNSIQDLIRNNKDLCRLGL